MILITEFMDEGWVDWLRARTDVIYEPGLPDRAQDLARLAQGAAALIVRNRTQVRGALLDAGFSCVGRLGVGLDNIDMAGCKERHIAVYPAHGANTRAVAEYVITTAAILLRGAYFMRTEMEAGLWPRAQAGQGREIFGKTLGLIGFGAIARATAQLAHSLGMAVVAYDPHVSAEDSDWDLAVPMSLESVLMQADVISLHVPLTPDTRHMMNAQAMATMKPGAVLINAARGGIVDERAMTTALKTGHLAGAALDVFALEPLEADPIFKGAPNLIITPHIGGVTEEANGRVSEMTARTVAHHLGLRAVDIED